MRDWPVDVLGALANDGGETEDPIFVFGSNLAGRHGRGAAYFAAKYHGAVGGVGEGLTGRAYALPTKDETLAVRSIDAIAQSVDRLIEVASSFPTTRFLVTRIGCGLAGYRDEAIAPLFANSPPNLDLPYRWTQHLSGSGGPRVIVAAPLGYSDSGVVQRNLDHLLSRSSDATVVTGQWHGARDLGAAYALNRWSERSVPFLFFPPDAATYGRAAAMVRYQEMARSSTHLVAFRNSSATEVGALFKLAQMDGLIVRDIQV
jgi:hypothetical protein